MRNVKREMHANHQSSSDVDSAWPFVMLAIYLLLGIDFEFESFLFLKTSYGYFHGSFFSMEAPIYWRKNFFDFLCGGCIPNSICAENDIWVHLMIRHGYENNLFFVLCIRRMIISKYIIRHMGTSCNYRIEWWLCFDHNKYIK